MIKFLALFSFLLTVPSLSAQSDTIILKGEYQGKNIYFQSHNASCIQKITVNGKGLGMGNPDFEIDLGAYKLKNDDPVIIFIIHKKGCAPKVVNPEGLSPSSTFEIVSIAFDKAGVLNWTAKHETGKLIYKLEQFVCHKWLVLAEIKEKSKGQNDYSYKPKTYSGTNMFRLKQIGPTGEARLSQTAEYTSSAKPVAITTPKFVRELVFSDSTSYEIYDKFGTKLKKGFGKTVDCIGLQNDIYSLNYGNQSESVKIEKVQKK